MADSLALTELTELKYQRMKTCEEIQRRSGWRPPYALTTALELQAIEMPRLSAKCGRLRTGTVVAVSDANKKYRVKGVAAVVWPYPIDTVMVERQFRCVSPACTWAMFSSYLELEELIVLADSMMRRNRRLRRAEMDELIAYLDVVEAHVRTIREEGRRAKLFQGFDNCRRALLVARAGTDSSMETRTRLAVMKYGLDCPQVNYPFLDRKNGRSWYLDLAYPEFKVCIEYDGSHHAGRWLDDVRRRQAIEDEGWRYIQVTNLDIGDDEGEAALAQRIAKQIQEVTGKQVPLTSRKTILQVCDARTLRRKPMHEQLRFEPLLPVDGAFNDV